VLGSIISTEKGPRAGRKRDSFKNEGKRTQKSRGISNLCKRWRRSEPTEIPPFAPVSDAKLSGFYGLKTEDRRQVTNPR